MICRLCMGSGALELREKPWSWRCVCCDGTGVKAMDGPTTTSLRSSYALPESPVLHSPHQKES